MFKFLQRIFGKSSSSYESMMDSRDPRVALSQQSIKLVKDALKPIQLPAYSLSLVKQSEIVYPKLPQGSKWPVNKKGEPLLYMGTVKHTSFSVAIFQHRDGLKKDDSNVQIIIINKSEESLLESLKPENDSLISQMRYQGEKIESLPIWEEIIHRNKDVHKLIVKQAPNHPWSLYKYAKKELVDTIPQEQLGGYPQWLINNVDFRKINNCEFLIQLYSKQSGQILYFFMDSETIFMIKQND